MQGEVWTCGCGAYGQLGQGDNKKRTKLVKVKVIKEPVRAIATKLSHCVSIICTKFLLFCFLRLYN